MTRKIAPQFKAGPLSRRDAELLSELARDLYSIYGAFGTAAPLNVRQDASGVHHFLDTAALSSLTDNTAILAVTSLAPSTQTLADGGSASLFPATLYTLNAGVWAAGASVYYLGANGEVPPLSLRLLVREIAATAAGVAVYSQDRDTAVVQVTSLTTQSVALAGGGTLTCYPGKAQVPNGSGGWTAGTTAWLNSLNGEVPALDNRYAATVVGMDTSGNLVLGVDVRDASDLANITLTGPWTWDVNDNFWTIEDDSQTSGTGGYGGIILTAPIEICGFQFWCCTAVTLNLGLYTAWQLPSNKTVYDLVATQANTIIGGIVPVAFGPVINTGDITNATNASPIVLTVPGWTTQPPVGFAVKVLGVQGNTAANGTFTVLDSTATTVTLEKSTGNGAFAASPGSTVQLAGPALIALVNSSTQPITLNSTGALCASPSFEISIPPAFGDLIGPNIDQSVAAGLAYKAQTTGLVLRGGDAAILWWDYCMEYRWIVLATSALVYPTVSNTVASGEPTQLQQPCWWLYADNTVDGSTYVDNYKFGRIVATALGGLAAHLDWQGLRVSDGTTIHGPEPDLEFISSCGIDITVTDVVAERWIQVELSTTGATQSLPVVTAIDFDPTTCELSYTMHTLVLDCGLIASVS